MYLVTRTMSINNFEGSGTIAPIDSKSFKKRRIASLILSKASSIVSP